MRKTVIAYCRALETGRYSDAADLLDPVDLLAFWKSMCQVQDALASVGEETTSTFLLGHNNRNKPFLEYSPTELMTCFLAQTLDEPVDIPWEITTVDEVGPGRGIAVYSLMGFSNTLDLIHRNGRWYVKLRYGMVEMAQSFQEKVDEFKRRECLDSPSDSVSELNLVTLSGYADLSGKTVIEPRFSAAEEFSENLAAVKVISQWGYIGKDGQLLIPARFARAESFTEGVAWVVPAGTEDWKYALIDKTGSILIPPRFLGVENFSEGLAAVKEEKLWGYINTKGEWLIPPQYSFAESFEEGLATVVERDGSHSHIDRQGQSLMAED